MPGAIAGIVVGIQFLQPSDQAGRLMLYGGGGAAAGGFAAYFAVYVLQRVFGRRAVWVLGETISGGIVGIVVGVPLTDVVHGWGPLLLCPLGAAAMGLRARWQTRRRLQRRRHPGPGVVQRRNAADVGVELSITRKDAAEPDSYRVTGADGWAAVWLPAAAELGLDLVPRLGDGSLFRVPAAELPEVVRQLARLREWMASHGHALHVEQLDRVLPALAAVRPGEDEVSFR